MKIFSDFLMLILTFKEKLSVTEKNAIDGEEISDTENETEYVSVQDPLNMPRTASNEKTLIFKIPNVINDGNLIFAPGQGKIPVSILRDELR